MKIDSWAEARLLARALYDWLGEHCPVCGKLHSKACLDGGRCTRLTDQGVPCGHALTSVESLAEAVAETRLLLGDVPRPNEPSECPTCGGQPCVQGCFTPGRAAAKETS